jgi:hypothetical protein
MARTPLVVGLLVALLLVVEPLLVGIMRPAEGAAGAAVGRYPDLRTLPPTNLRLDSAVIGGSQHRVLRFSNTVWNAGPGRLELRGDSSSGRTVAYQRLYDGTSLVGEWPVGSFTYHPTHYHWHFEDFAQYELWTRTDYEHWLATGRTGSQARWRGGKVTFCIADTHQARTLPGSPSSPTYGAQCGQGLQGLSIGWGDTYPYSLPDQWIDLGSTGLTPGQYVLRSVADPLNLIHESPNKADLAVEGGADNEGVTAFSVTAGGSIVNERIPILAAYDQPAADGPAAAGARAANLIDGRLWTRWETAWRRPAQLSAVFDLGASQAIGHVRWHVAAAGYARDVTFQVGDTLAGPWGPEQTAARVDPGLTNNTWHVTPLNASGRYLRLIITNTGRQGRLGGVAELEVYR